MRRIRSTFLSITLFAAIAGTGNAGTVTVPFVGCPSDGQMPAPMPKGKPIAVKLDASTADRLAYFKSVSGGILAPRDWHCAGLWGSGGWILFVSPRRIVPEDYIAPKGINVTGPLIEISFNLGETSGRFEAAKIMARYFPAQRKFVEQVLDEGSDIVSRTDYPSGAFPNDRLMRSGRRFVEYLTPPNSRGLGTMGRLAPTAEAILSAAILMDQDAPDAPSAMTVAVRLPKDQEDLAPVILHWAEQRYAGEK